MPAAYKRRITQKERKDDGIERFITPSVPFAERRIIKMEKGQNKNRVVRITSLALILTLITTCMLGRYTGEVCDSRKQL